MKKFLGFPLTLLLGLAALVTMLYVPILWAYAVRRDYNYTSLNSFFAHAAPILIAAAFGLSIAYILVGVITYVAALVRKKKTKESSTYTEGIVLRGVIGVATSMSLYIILSFIISSFIPPYGTMLPTFY